VYTHGIYQELWVYKYVSILKYFHRLAIFGRITTKRLQSIRENEEDQVSNKIPSPGPFVDLNLKGRACMTQDLCRERGEVCMKTNEHRKGHVLETVRDTFRAEF
jgi:hypothetical protein